MRAAIRFGPLEAHQRRRLVDHADHADPLRPPERADPRAQVDQPGLPVGPRTGPEPGVDHGRLDDAQPGRIAAQVAHLGEDRRRRPGQLGDGPNIHRANSRERRQGDHMAIRKDAQNSAGSDAYRRA